MSYVIVFLTGLIVGVVQEKALRAWKERAFRAANAAAEALKTK